MKVYVASSWRNDIQPEVVKALVDFGFYVYDFKNPVPGENGFRWTEIDPEWQQWTPVKFREALRHPVAIEGFQRDMQALEQCDICVLVMPCGRSAHLELGYAVGADKHTVVLLPNNSEPELMYKMCDHLCTSMEEMLRVCLDIRKKEDE